MDYYEKLRKLFKKRRMELNMMQTEVAEIADISNNFYSNIERGKTKPSVDTMFKICKALKLSLDEIIFEDISSKKELQSKEIAKEFEMILKENNTKNIEGIIEFCNTISVILRKVNNSEGDK